MKPIARFMLISFALVALAKGDTVPTAFTYQGMLQRDGTTFTGQADFRFTLWDAPPSGQSVAGPLVIPATPVDGGRFTVELDFGQSVFGNEARWLEIAVCTQACGSPSSIHHACSATADHADADRASNPRSGSG